MHTLITYGSQYGSAKQYAQNYSERTGFPVSSYDTAKRIVGYDRVIHFGALYAGGVLGLKHIASLLPAEAELIVLTVGLADVHDAENIRRIRAAAQAQLPEGIFRRTQFFHLRGAIDYSRLRWKHRVMMALLHAKAKGLPEEQRNAETRAMLKTYGKQVSFVDEASLQRLADAIGKIDDSRGL